MIKLSLKFSFLLLCLAFSAHANDKIQISIQSAHVSAVQTCDIERMDKLNREKILWKKEVREAECLAGPVRGEVFDYTPIHLRNSKAIRRKKITHLVTEKQIECTSNILHVTKDVLKQNQLAQNLKAAGIQKIEIIFDDNSMDEHKAADSDLSCNVVAFDDTIKLRVLLNSEGNCLPTECNTLNRDFLAVRFSEIGSALQRRLAIEDDHGTIKPDGINSKQIPAKPVSKQGVNTL